MVSEELQTGDPVWAKMKGYPPWPAKIMDPPSDGKSPKNKKSSYVFFFGTGDHAWISNENIIPHSESMLLESKNRKKASERYKNGIDALVSYSKSFKKIKQPKLIKKDSVETDELVTKKTKIVKIISDDSKKYDRKVLTKSLIKKVKRKRSFYDYNGESPDYYSSKHLKFKDFHPGHFTTVKDINLSDARISIQQNEEMQNMKKNIIPSNLRFGFIGLGLMGKQIVKSLLESGHNVTIWNKTASQCDTLLDMGAKRARFPSDLIMSCDVTFSCVSDPEATKAVIFGDNGVLNGFEQAYDLGMYNRGYVELTNIDPATSQKVCEAVLMKNGCFLEAQICGTSKGAEEGNLLIVAAGDQKLFEKCETCFYSIGKNAYYVSCEIGDGSVPCLVYSSLCSCLCAALAEALVLVERLKLQKSFFLEYLINGPIGGKDIIDKWQKMVELAFEKITALKHVQKDSSLVLSIANQNSQQVLVTAASNEIYKRGKLRNYSNEDRTAVYKVVKY